MSGEFEPNDSRNVTGTASTPDGHWTAQGQQPPLAGGQSPEPTRQRPTQSGDDEAIGDEDISGEDAGGEDIGGEDLEDEDDDGVQFTPDEELIRKVDDAGGASGRSGDSAFGSNGS